MKYMTLVFILVLSTTVTSSAQPASKEDTQQAGTLMIELTGFESDRGVVRVGLVRSKQAYDNDGPDFRDAKSAVTDRQAQVTFEDVPYGEYGVRVYHDENENGELDTNFMGIPKESYGFSNNARGRFGPPAYDAIAFALDEPELTLTIRVE